MKLLSSNKIINVIVILTLSFFIGLMVTRPTEACACGMLEPQFDKDISMTGERGIVVFDSKLNKEQLVIDFRLEGTSSKTALVVPTPVKADISQVKKEVFDDLDDILSPRSIDVMPQSIGDNLFKSTGVTVLEEKTVGNFEIAELKANSFKDLSDWSNDNGFYLKPEAEAPLKKFIDNKFVLNVIKLKKDADTSDINPLKFTFGTKKYFYPLMEINDAKNDQKDKSLELYLVTDQEIDLPYANTLNRYVSKSNLEEDITKTTETDFSNLDFSNNYYYITFVSVDDYTKEPVEGGMFASMNNPTSDDFTSFGVEKNILTDNILWLYVSIIAIIVTAVGFYSMYFINVKKLKTIKARRR